DIAWDVLLADPGASPRATTLFDEIPEARKALDAVGTKAAAPEGPAQHGPLTHRLTGLSEAERDTALLDLVRTEVAAVLGYGTPEA
ncbi:acyl carrier protein, partial [Saccharothrix sp. ST-888]|uniref:acyl carrier protein n=1 Tax=Saccharothrix sp. ST-888 TaxID=1427391 RepID=UPI0005ECBBD6